MPDTCWLTKVREPLDVGDLLLEWLRVTQQIKVFGSATAYGIGNSVDGWGSAFRNHGSLGNASLVFAGNIGSDGPQHIVVGFVTDGGLELTKDYKVLSEEGIELDAVVVPTDAFLSELEDYVEW